MTTSQRLRKTAEEAERLAREAVVPAERNALIRFALDWRKLEARAAMQERQAGAAGAGSRA